MRLITPPPPRVWGCYWTRMFFRSKFVRFKEVFTEFRLFAKCLVLQELSYFVWLKKTWLSIFVLFCFPPQMYLSFFASFVPPFSPWIPHLDEQRRQPGSPSFGISRRSKPPKALSAYLNTHVATPNHWRNLGLSPLLALLVIWDLLEKPACPALLETSSP